MIAWDKLLETCYRRGTDLLLVPGSPPWVRTADGWRALQIPPLMSDEVRFLASEQFVGREDWTGNADGFAFLDVKYGDVKFRLMAYGFPETTFIIATLKRDPG